MFIFDKNRGYAVNSNEIKDIFKGRDKGVVTIGFTNGIVTKLAAYDTDAEAIKAIELIMKQMEVNKRCVIEVPGKENVKMALRSDNDQAEKHHITGKKTKGHGGS